jgi:hypothetical protein
MPSGTTERGCLNMSGTRSADEIHAMTSEKRLRRLPPEECAPQQPGWSARSGVFDFAHAPLEPGPAVAIELCASNGVAVASRIAIVMAVAAGKRVLMAVSAPMRENRDATTACPPGLFIAAPIRTTLLPWFTRCDWFLLALLAPLAVCARAPQSRVVGPAATRPLQLSVRVPNAGPVNRRLRGCRRRGF